MPNIFLLTNRGQITTWQNISGQLVFYFLYMVWEFLNYMLINFPNISFYMIFLMSRSNFEDITPLKFYIPSSCVYLIFHLLAEKGYVNFMDELINIEFYLSSFNYWYVYFILGFLLIQLILKILMYRKNNQFDVSRSTTV